MRFSVLILIILINNGESEERQNFNVPNFAMLVKTAVKFVNTEQAVIFDCHRKGLFHAASILMRENILVQLIDLKWSNFSLANTLTLHNHARTSVVLNCICNKSLEVLTQSSEGRYFNKTFQWFLWDGGHFGIQQLLPSTLSYLGPNAQIIYGNSTTFEYLFWDVHSKGFHLGSSLELNLIAKLQRTFLTGPQEQLKIYENIFHVQGIQFRDQFQELTLRGATVIDQDLVNTNKQIESILSRPTKEPGVAAFVKYHYELLLILRDRFNFKVNFRNARGWAGRLGNTRFRLGFLGIIMRNEADIGASGAFNRINRFAEFDTIHQGWKFETAFLYRFTPDLDTHGKSGNFLAPFHKQVWIISLSTLLAINCIWRLVEWINQRWRSKSCQAYQKRIQSGGKSSIHNVEQSEKIYVASAVSSHGNHNHNNNKNAETSFAGSTIKTFAAVCQQGIDPMPNSLPSRTIVFCLFLFSLVMYNYYTSSVVGGLLSSVNQGPSTVDEIILSPLKLAFEDIGYYKVLFRENKSPQITWLINRKLEPRRDPFDLPIYTQIDAAIPYIQNGSFAFHCEVVDAYPEIAKHFDAPDICDLRVVPGLLETEVMNWVVHKNSQYTELFRIVMSRTREVGLIDRLLRERQPKKPQCQSVYTVYPVSLLGTTSAFMVLFIGTLLAIVVLAFECLVVKRLKTNLKAET